MAKHKIEVTEDYLFPSMVWFADLPDASALNAALMTDIAQQRTAVKSVKKSNELGWHSPTNFQKRAAYKPLCARIDDMAETIADSMNMRQDRRLTIETLWVNVNPKYAYNALHDHPQSVISGVYYVRVDDKTGKLRFRDPRAGKRMNPWPVDSSKSSDQRHWDRVSYTPKAGRLIMFPSWLEHDVEANLSEEDRISVSFNMALHKIAPAARK